MSVSTKFRCYICGKDAPTSDMVHFVVPKFKKDIKMCFPCYGYCLATINEINVDYGIDREKIKEEQLENKQNAIEVGTFRCELCGAVEFDGYTAQIITPKDKLNMCNNCCEEMRKTILCRNNTLNYLASPMHDKTTARDIIEACGIKMSGKDLKKAEQIVFSRIEDLD